MNNILKSEAVCGVRFRDCDVQLSFVGKLQKSGKSLAAEALYSREQLRRSIPKASDGGDK